jgi:hypothetical protein
MGLVIGHDELMQVAQRAMSAYGAKGEAPRRVRWELFAAIRHPPVEELQLRRGWVSGVATKAGRSQLIPSPGADGGGAQADWLPGTITESPVKSPLAPQQGDAIQVR